MMLDYIISFCAGMVFGSIGLFFVIVMCIASIVETIKRDIDRYTEDYTIVDIDRIRCIIADYVDGTTEEILDELKSQIKKKLKRDLAKILEG